MSTKYLVISLAMVSLATADPASFFKKCNVDDTKCFKETTASAIPIFALGIPELGVETLDPYFFKKIDASTSNLKLILSDITVKGLKNCKPRQVELDVKQSTLTVKLLCDVVGDGDYEMSGQVLVVHMEGKGKVQIGLHKIEILVKLTLGDKIGDDGKTYWDIKDWIHTYKLKAKSSLNFENLSSGNEVLGRVARELVQNSPNELIDEVGKPIIKIMTAKVVEQVKNLFKKLSKDDLVNWSKK